ncbi:phosphoribosyltransferase-like protein [Cantharellus anzutake]|uniref:phosphoribosyltransferase-like protein n=1 Tax=Cantharellus anzutake TaxID=1750568 RepID=UPI001905594A|nr:phosphoribosyltransferase-like protein [Cantharellus anzutake]KAF8324283.1 phosphoribosyltransferase-like protein [Cantharellus anzutake]
MASLQEQLEKYTGAFIKSSLDAGALKFGSFTLKSGRQSPYFFNSGMLNTGSSIATLASAYAALIQLHFPPPSFDVLFGPAYKGIPLGAATSVALYNTFGTSVGFAYNRKEAKDHGEGGWHVGADVKGKKVLILDDVFTSGMAIRQVAQGIREAGGTIVGVVLCLDRQEIGKEGEVESAKTALVRDLGGAEVYAVLTINELITYLEKEGRSDEVAQMKAYREKYGIKQPQCKDRVY